MKVYFFSGRLVEHGITVGFLSDLVNAKSAQSAMNEVPRSIRAINPNCQIDLIAFNCVEDKDNSRVSKNK